jgi:hypothetical protein
MKKLGFLFLGLCFLFVSCGEENVKNNAIVSTPAGTGGDISSYPKVMPSLLGNDKDLEILLITGSCNDPDMLSAKNSMDYVIIGDTVNSSAYIEINTSIPKERYRINNFPWETVLNWSIPNNGLPVVLTGTTIERAGINYDYYTSAEAKKAGYVVEFRERLQADSTIKKVEVRVPVESLVLEYDFDLTSIKEK